MAHDIFISHAAEDRSVADAVCAALEARGLSCWLTPRDQRPGEDAADAVARAGLLIPILSAASAVAPQVQREVECAADRGVPILAFRIAEAASSPSLERLLSGAETLDALTPPVAPHLDYLGDRAVRLVEAGGAAPGRQLTQPPRPFRAPGRGAAGWLPIVAAGVAGVAAIALAAMYVNQ